MRLEDDERVVLLGPKNTEDGYLIESGFVTSDKNVDIPDAETVWSLKENNKLTDKSPIKLSWTNNQGLIFKKEISLDDPWKAAYKRQMDLYVWILRRMEFDVSDEGIFLYCDGDRFSNKSFLGEAIAQMEFKISILIHHVDTSWIEPTLFKVKDCLTSLSPADHVDGCEIGSFLAAAK